MQNTVRSNTSTATFRTEAFTFVLLFRLLKVMCKFALPHWLGLHALGVRTLLRFEDNRAYNAIRQQLIGIRRNVYVADVAEFGCL